LDRFQAGRINSSNTPKGIFSFRVWPYWVPSYYRRFLLIPSLALLKRVETSTRDWSLNQKKFGSSLSYLKEVILGIIPRK